MRFRRGALDADVEVVHPGHSAVQTTRLLRHDHGGLAALVEAERQWAQLEEADVAGSSNSASLLQAAGEVLPVEDASRRPAGWVMATAQFEALRRHQRTALVRPKQQTSLVELAGADEDEDAKDQPTALRLSSLSSEYVGPIGVGSTYSSPACAAMAQQMAGRARNGTSMLQGCKVQAQSQVWVVFDTGSTNIWVNSDACVSGSCAHRDRHRYDHTKSSSYEKASPASTLSVTFGTGGMKGPMAVDAFNIGPVSVHGQGFAMIEEQTGSVFESVPLEGIVGLAFPAMAAKGTTPFLENVIRQKALPHNEVAFYFSAENPSANAMLWGGVDRKFYEGPIEYFNVARPWYWGLNLKAFKIGTENMLETVGDDSPSFAEDPESDNMWQGIVDSGTTYITAPTALFEQIMERLPEGLCKDMTDESHPPITLVFENAAGADRDFSLDNTQYMVREGEHSATSVCTPAISQINLHGEHAKSMLVGQVFMKWYFTVFDRMDGNPANARVGFAKATQGRSVNKHLKTITSEQFAFNDHHGNAFETHT